MYYYEDKIVSEEKLDNGYIVVKTKSDDGVEMEYALSPKRYEFCVKDNVEDSNPTVVFDAMMEEFAKEIREKIKEYGFTLGEAKTKIFQTVARGFDNDVRIAASKALTGSQRVHSHGVDPLEHVTYGDIEK